MPVFLHIEFRSKLIKYIKKNATVLLALSSGQDSLCLLQLLKDNLYQQQNKIYAVYIDHQWKNDSFNHTHHLINLTRSKNIPTAVYQIKTLSLSENNARQIRYKTLIKHAKKKLSNYHYWS